MKRTKRTVLILTLVLPLTILVSSAASAKGRIEAAIFSFDGTDFVRTETTIKTKGQPTEEKLDHGSAAYKALIEKRSYTGTVPLLGKNYLGRYAPLTKGDGALAGAIFVGVAE